MSTHGNRFSLGPGWRILLSDAGIEPANALSADPAMPVRLAYLDSTLVPPPSLARAGGGLRDLGGSRAEAPQRRSTGHAAHVLPHGRRTRRRVAAPARA